MSQDDNLCSKCGQRQAEVVTRKKKFCKECFVHFVSGKQTKQMNGDRFRVKFGTDLDNRTPTVLTPLLFDSSSLVLTEILLCRLQEQLERSSRAHVGFYLTILCMCPSQPLSWVAERVDQIKQRHPQWESLSVKFELVDFNQFIEGKSVRTMHLTKDFQAFMSDANHDGFSLDQLMSQVSDKSVKEDLLRLIKNEIISAYALKLGSSVLVLPDSTTELAVSVLGLTARGRGGRIWETVGTSTILDGKCELIYALRDVFQREIVLFEEFTGLCQLEAPSESSIKKSIKNKTIDELILEYFGTVEEDHPDTVPTVVKVGGKLGKPASATSACAICKGPIYGDSKSWLDKITCSEGVPLKEEDMDNYRRYLEAQQDRITIPPSSQGQPVSVCYGCMVALNTIKRVKWPTDEDIIAQYTL